MTQPTALARQLRSRIALAMQDTPVIVLIGPRQSGKTTLVRELATPQMRYFTLDDALTLLSARQDPQGMIRGLEGAVIDEVQRAPELLLAVKKSVDEDRRPGRFVLTGSANLLTLPKVAESLAGRMETLTLLPLSQSEMAGQGGDGLNWLDSVFSGHIPTTAQPAVGADLIDRALRGGYPEAVARPTPQRRAAWAKQYVDAIVQRDVRDVAGVDKLDHMPRLLKALTHSAGQMCNYAPLGAQLGIDAKTASRYIGIFEQVFLLQRVPAWARNRLKRGVKTPKLQFLDSGLLASLMGLRAEEVQRDRRRFGPALETFVHAELLKHLHASDEAYQLMYYRDTEQVEVDVVIENAAGQIIAIEVKASATVRQEDLRGLRKLQGLAGDAFKRGLLLYDGTETLPLGHNIWAAPVASLWGR